MNLITHTNKAALGLWYQGKSYIAQIYFNFLVAKIWVIFSSLSFIYLFLVICLFADLSVFECYASASSDNIQIHTLQLL